MAFPTTSVLDQFTGTNGTDLPVYSANWQSTLAGFNPLEIQGNAATGTTGNCLQFWATSYGPNSEVYVTISTAPGGANIVGMFIRGVQETSITTIDGYTLQYASGALAFYRVDNAVQTLLGSSISQTVSAGDSIGVESAGSTHTIYYKASGGSWTSLGTRTDSTYSSAGKPGLLCTDATVRIDNFGAGTINQFLTPSLFTNTQTFYAPTVTPGAVSLTPSLVTNNQTFYAPTVLSTYGLLLSLVTNAQTFYGATVTPGAVSLLPSLVTESQTFYSPTVSQAGVQDLQPSLVTNAQTFYGAVVTSDYTLSPSLLTNSQTFYSPTVDAQNTLLPPLVTNEQTFYSAVVSPGVVDIQPTLVTNDQIFYSATVLLQANQELLPGGLINEQTFYSPTIEAQSERIGGDDAYHHTGWDKKAWKKKQKQEQALEDTIRKTYLKAQGIEPTPEVIAEVVEEVKETAPQVAKPEKFDYSGVMEWLQAQESIVAQIIARQQEEDDEEALLLLL